MEYIELFIIILIFLYAHYFVYKEIVHKKFIIKVGITVLLTYTVQYGTYLFVEWIYESVKGNHSSGVAIWYWTQSVTLVFIVVMIMLHIRERRRQKVDGVSIVASN